MSAAALVNVELLLGWPRSFASGPIEDPDPLRTVPSSSMRPIDEPLPLRTVSGPPYAASPRFLDEVKRSVASAVTSLAQGGRR